MRLLNAKTMEFQEFFDSDIPKYAILSHRWGSDEVTFKDFKKGLQREREGFTKVKFCCKQASHDNYDWVWADTCCIDKRSSAELTEAINSMYKWYKDAAVCYVHLADVHWMQSHSLSGWRREIAMEQFCGSSWFKRGWTLQELLAPYNVRFYDQTWQFIGNKDDLVNEISDTTGIDVHWLTKKIINRYEECKKAADCQGHRDFLALPSVATKMSWASKRRTSRTEDMAYCLLGLFDVYMPLLYGEGRKAFRRLVQEIIRTTDDDSIFAWTSSISQYYVLPDWPDNFADSRYVHNVSGRFERPPYTLTNRGLSFPVTYRSIGTYWGPFEDEWTPTLRIPLNCGMCGPRGFEYLVLEIYEGNGMWFRNEKHRLELVQIDGAQLGSFREPSNLTIDRQHKESAREEQESRYNELREINIAVAGFG
ncbi:MAG: hypothetical protein LQ342_007996 [Letrouitia transgressa]|nr:MAG: hypothetical protein LQ342_007996 [Letrouitia transgressa]